MNGKIFFVPTCEHEGTAEDCAGCMIDPQDVTEAVGALYDLTLASMDYRSGFWSYEDAAPVAEMAELMGYEGRDGIVKYRDEQLFDAQQAAYLRDHGINKYNIPTYYERVVLTRPDGSMVVQHLRRTPEHDHEFATIGKCMYPYCEEKQ